jgi:hypothetical protein
MSQALLYLNGAIRYWKRFGVVENKGKSKELTVSPNCFSAVALGL